MKISAQTIRVNELAFVLFLASGLFKADPRFVWIPFDLTIFFLLISVFLYVKDQIIQFRKLFLNVNYVPGIFLVFAFFLTVLISILWSPSTYYAFEKSVGMILNIIAFLTAAFFVSPSNNNRGLFFSAYLILGCFFAITSFFFPISSLDGVQVFNATYLSFGRFVGLAGVISFYYFYADRSFYRKIIYAAFSVFVIFSLLTSGARGPSISLTVAFTFIAIINTRIRSRNSTLSTVVLLTAVLILLPVAADQTFRTFDRFSIIEVSDTTSSAGERINYANISIPIWSEAPFFGNGVGSWPVLVGFGDSRNYPHNIILEILVEQGILGLAFFVFTIFLIIRRLFDCVEKEYLIFLTALLVYLFINALFSGDLSDNRIFFALLGICSNIAPTNVNKLQLTFDSIRSQ